MLDCDSLFSLFSTTLLVVNELCCLTSHNGVFDCKHVSVTATDDNCYLHDTLLHANQHTHMHKNAAGQDNKAGGLEYPMHALTTLHFSAFPVHSAIGG